MGKNYKNKFFFIPPVEVKKLSTRKKLDKDKNII